MPNICDLCGASKKSIALVVSILQIKYLHLLKESLCGIPCDDEPNFCGARVMDTCNRSSLVSPAGILLVGNCKSPSQGQNGKVDLLCLFVNLETWSTEHETNKEDFYRIPIMQMKGRNIVFTKLRNHFQKTK